MKGLLFTLLIGIIAHHVHAQLYIGSDAKSFFVRSGEIIQYDGLAITPSADLTISNTKLTKTDANTISPTPIGAYINRYFSFSNTTPAFSGKIKFSYAGTSLNGLTAGTLRLNIRNNTVWTGGFGTDVGTGGGNYVEAVSLNSSGLNTLTLAADGAALPIQCIKFVAEKKGNAAVLAWTTETEKNTLDFLVQQSTKENGWKTIGSVQASRNTTNLKDYSFTDYAPSPGYNYYRLVQRDQDGQVQYSKVVSLLMEGVDRKLNVFPNPVQDGQLKIVLKEPTQVKLFNIEGRQVLSQQMNAGVEVLDVSRLQKGVYHLKAGSENITIFIK